jgi:sulfite reductase (NADPH) flavoprotein alpha-component
MGTRYARFTAAIPNCEFAAAELIALLKPLQHRAYSISPAVKCIPIRCTWTVASVR